MVLRVLFLVVATFVLTACVTTTERTGLDFAALSQKVGPPKPGSGRIVVFREKGYADMFDSGWELRLDDEPLSPLRTGTYVYADRGAGHHKLSTAMGLLREETQSDVMVAPGHVYYFFAKPSLRLRQINAMSAAGGIAGYIIGSAVTSADQNPGPLDFFPIDEAAARTMMADIRLAEGPGVR